MSDDRAFEPSVLDTKALLGAALPSAPVELISLLAQRVTIHRAVTGSVICAAGDRDRWLDVVGDGTLVVEPVNGHAPTTLSPPATYGSWTLIGNGGRNATIRAQTDATVLRLSGTTFDELVADGHLGFALRSAVEATARTQLRETSFSWAIREAWKVSEPAVIEQFRRAATFRTLAAGEVLVTEGQQAHSAFLVVSGSLRVNSTARGPQGAQNVRERTQSIGAGQIVGERALLDGGTRSATVIAARATEVAEFDGVTFRQLVATHPDVLLRIVEELLHRQEPRHGNARTFTTRVAIIGDSSVAAHEIASALIDSISGRARTIAAPEVEEALGFVASDSVGSNHEFDSARVLLWLGRRDRVEIELLVAEANEPKWTSICLEHADRIVAVRDAHSPDREHPVWRSGRKPTQHTSLLIRHPATTTSPSGTAALLRRFPADDHFHIRSGRVDDNARVMRSILGEPFGLVLSGGGARGFAHIGALRSMQELGIPCDTIGGTSIGAVMACLHGLGLTVDEHLHETETRFRGLLDYTLPVVSLLKGKRTSDRLVDLVGDRDIEDLWIPFFCVSTNLTTNDVHVHDRGSLALAVRASLALPGIFPPVHDGTNFLVDGGVLNNFPLDVMRARNPHGKVIAVDVAANVRMTAGGNFGLALSGWRAAVSILRKRPLAPSLTNTLARTAIIGSARERDRYLRDGYADLHLELALEGVALLDFEEVPRVARFGYDAAHPRLREWWATMERPFTGSGDNSVK